MSLKQVALGLDSCGLDCGLAGLSHIRGPIQFIGCFDSWMLGVQFPVRRQKLHQDRKERPQHIQMILGSGDERIKPLFEVAWPCLRLLHSVHLLKQIGEHRVLETSRESLARRDAKTAS